MLEIWFGLQLCQLLFFSCILLWSYCYILCTAVEKSASLMFFCFGHAAVVHLKI